MLLQPLAAWLAQRAMAARAQRHDGGSGQRRWLSAAATASLDRERAAQPHHVCADCLPHEAGGLQSVRPIRAIRHGAQLLCGWRCCKRQKAICRQLPESKGGLDRAHAQSMRGVVGKVSSRSCGVTASGCELLRQRRQSCSHTFVTAALANARQEIPCSLLILTPFLTFIGTTTTHRQHLKTSAANGSSRRSRRRQFRPKSLVGEQAIDAAGWGWAGALL